MKVRFFIFPHFQILHDSTISPDKEAAHCCVFSQIRGLGGPRKVGPEAILRCEIPLTSFPFSVTVRDVSYRLLIAAEVRLAVV
jgi:hypothetical protein